MLSIGRVPLDGSPRVVLALRDGADRAEVDRCLTQGVDLVELRIDQFASFETASVLTEVKRFAGVPVLATIRMAAEGGGWNRSEDERAALYQAILPLVDAVDIELSAGDIAGEILAAAHAAGKTTIGSYHDFKRVPCVKALGSVVRKGQELGADITKIAAFCHSPADLRRLTRFTLDNAATPIVVMGMGPHGAASRVFFPALGSLLTYTFLGEPTAPGQLNCATLIQYLAGIFPGFESRAGKP